MPDAAGERLGEHNIQGIGDKHLPLIHNIMNHDLVSAISDKATDQLEVLTTEVGKRYLAGRACRRTRHRPARRLRPLLDLQHPRRDLVRKGPDLTENDVIITVATDGSQMYPPRSPRSPSATSVASSPSSTRLRSGGAPRQCPDQRHLELTEKDRNRIFNLGYYTWVEQQGTLFELFEQRRSQDFWIGLRPFIARWDAMIEDFNAKVAAK